MTSRKTLDIDFITLRKIRAVDPVTNALITPNFILAMDNQGQAQWVNTLSNINTYGGVTGFTGPTGPMNQSAMVTLVASSNQSTMSGTPSVVQFPSIDLSNSTATNFGITWDSSGSVFTNTSDLPLQVLLTWQIGWNQLPGARAEYLSLTTYAQVNGANSYGYQTNDYGLGDIKGNANPSQTSSCVVLLDPSSSFSIYVNQINNAGCPATISSASKLIMTLVQTGPQGATGEMGHTGMTGPTGIQGPTGYTGMTGPAGIINITTVQGITGNILYTSNIPDPSGVFYSTFATIIDNNGTGILGINGSVQIGPSGTISSDVSGNLILNTNLLPATGYAYDLGSTGQPWNELYVGTGSVHIGPTGTLSADQSGNMILQIYDYLALTGPQGFSKVYDEVYNPPPTISVILTSGTSYTIPSAASQYLVEYTLYGGGGGGGGGGFPFGSGGGGGGGGSGYVTSGQVILSLGTALQYSIGSGGSGGLGFSLSTNGSPTTLTINPTRSPPLIIEASGGFAGGFGDSSVGGDGGAGSFGGGGGGSGIYLLSTGQGGVGLIQSGNIGTTLGGDGGGAINGGDAGGGGGGGIGGGIGGEVTNNNGTNATLFGCGGGGGAAKAGSETSGGSGSQGAIILRITPM